MAIKNIIGVTGTISSGKDVTAAYICDTLGIKNYSLSDEIRYEAASRGLDNSRENLFNIANEIRSRFGIAELSKRVLNRINEDLAVVTSIRNLGELKFLRENSNLFFISVDAPIRLRYERSRDRGRIGDGETFEQFRQAEEKELVGNEHEQQLTSCMRAADYFIVNDGTLEELYGRIDEIIKAILSQRVVSGQ